MAQEFSGFFNNTQGAEHSYDAAEMATAFRALGGNGVHSLGEGLALRAEGGTMRTLASPGLAMIRGYVYELKDDGGAKKMVTHPASASNERVDRVVLRLDLTGTGSIALMLLTGTPGATPQPPALTRTSTVYEISLAKVRIRAGTTSIAAEDITDERKDEAACGALAPEALKLSTLWERLAKPNATPSAPGLMAAADKSALDALKAALTVSAAAVDLGGRYLDNALFR